MLQTLLLLWRHPLADRLRHPSPGSNSINMSLWVQLISNKCWQLTNGKCASYLHTASTFARQFSHSQQSSSADFSGQYCGHCPEMVLFKRILLSQDIDRNIHHDSIASHASAWVVRNGVHGQRIEVGRLVWNVLGGGNVISWSMCHGRDETESSVVEKIRQSSKHVADP